MNLCSNGHDEVCFNGYDCPVCEAESTMMYKLDTLQDRLDEKDERIQELIDIIKVYAPEELL